MRRCPARHLRVSTSMPRDPLHIHYQAATRVTRRPRPPSWSRAQAAQAKPLRRPPKGSDSRIAPTYPASSLAPAIAARGSGLHILWATDPIPPESAFLQEPPRRPPASGIALFSDLTG